MQFAPSTALNFTFANKSVCCGDRTSPRGHQDLAPVLQLPVGKQMPDAEKRRRADFIVDSSHPFDHAREQMRDNE
jgi:dephospho-CoA kinase